jgi:hypothetical protein
MVFRRLASVALAVALLFTAGAGEPREIVNKAVVKQMDVGYRLEDGRLTIRVTLDSGQALEHVATEPSAVDHLLKLAQLFSSGGARVFAEFQGGRLIALDVEAGLASIARPR